MPRTEAQKVARKRQKKARQERKRTHKVMDGHDYQSGYRGHSVRGWMKTTYNDDDDV